MIPAKRLVLVLAGVLIISTLLIALTSAGILQLRNDDGAFHQGSHAGRVRGDIDGAVFTPRSDLFPITLHSVEFAFHRPQDSDHIGDSARVRVQIYVIEDGAVGDLLVESRPSTFSGFDKWHSVPIPGPLSLEEPAHFMAAVKWESGDDQEPAPSTASDSNVNAPQTAKDRANRFYDTDVVFRSPDCPLGEFCTHSQYWESPSDVGFNMIRVTVGSPRAPTETPGGPATTPTVTLTPRSPVGRGEAYLPAVFRNFARFAELLRSGDEPGESVSHALASGRGMADQCLPVGDANNLWVGREPPEERGVMRSVLWFDLGAVPSDASVLEASLRLATIEAGVGDEAPMPVTVHDISKPWSGCPSWTGLSGAFGEVWATVSVSTGVGMYHVDVAELAKAWLSGGLPNYGLMLRGDETQAGRVRGFAPTNSTQEDLRPVLLVRFRRP